MGTVKQPWTTQDSIQTLMSIVQKIEGQVSHLKHTCNILADENKLPVPYPEIFDHTRPLPHAPEQSRTLEGQKL